MTSSVTLDILRYDTTLCFWCQEPDEFMFFSPAAQTVEQWSNISLDRVRLSPASASFEKFLGSNLDNYEINLRAYSFLLHSGLRAVHVHVERLEHLIFLMCLRGPLSRVPKSGAPLPRVCSAFDRFAPISEEVEEGVGGEKEVWGFCWEGEGRVATEKGR